MTSEDRPELSVVVVVHNMAREVCRTLDSLSATYQRDIAPEDYEIIVVDNGSSVPIDASVVERFNGSIRLIRLDSAPASPAHAINRGLAEARGQIIGTMIDGARLVTPGLLHFARCGARLYPQAMVVAPGWYLGSDYQSLALLAGYNAAEENALLQSINWPADGYRLFEIATPDESSLDLWFSDIQDSRETMLEASVLFMTRERWDALGGFDERFDLPGGGFVNSDTYRRALGLSGTRLVVTLGEGTFHQLHGGVATNANPAEFRQRMRAWQVEYFRLRGPQSPTPPAPQQPPTYLGTLPPAARMAFVRAVIDPVRRPPLDPRGPEFDLWSWPDSPREDPVDPTAARLVGLLRSEFRAGRYDSVAAIARLARSYAPTRPDALRLLRSVAPYFDPRFKLPHSARFHLALGRAHALLGDDARAVEALQDALDLDPGLSEAHDALAAVNQPHEVSGSSGLSRT